MRRDAEGVELFAGGGREDIFRQGRSICAGDFDDHQAAAQRRGENECADFRDADAHRCFSQTELFTSQGQEIGNIFGGYTESEPAELREHHPPRREEHPE